jgi:hypothetical protein
MKYLVSPQRAYEKWTMDNGGVSPRGDLYYTGGVCIGCGQRQCYYSAAGYRELSISGMCEPCFDFVAVPVQDREKLDEWMSLVTYNKKDG